MRQSLRIAVLATLTHAVTSSAWAYQTVTSGPSGAALYDKPAAGAAVKARVKAGATLTASDQATNGYYNVSTASGTSGWATAGSLVFSGAGPSGTRPSRGAKSGSHREKPDSSSFKRFYVAGMGGIGLAGNGGFPTFGGELGFKLSPSWAVGAYGTYLKITGATTASGAQSTIGVNLLTFAGTLDYYLIPSLHVGVKAGYELATVTPSTPGLQNSTNGFAGGAGAGYDLTIAGGLSVGVQLDGFYMIGGTSGTLATALGTLKFAF